MANNDIYLMQQYFLKYIDSSNEVEKQLIIKECLMAMPNRNDLIKRLQKILNNLNKQNEIKFINNVFNIENNNINFDLIYNIESQIDTQQINEINNDIFNIISFYNFEKEVTKEKLKFSNKKVIMNDNSQKYLIKINSQDTYFYNYIVEMFFEKGIENLILLTNSENNYIASDYLFPEISSNLLVKEESLCETKDIQYFIDRRIGKNAQRDKYLRRIFLDLITNENYRILNNGFGVINSDLKQIDYYVLDGVTLKKEAIIESFLRNYYPQIENIVNLIVDNYELITDLINDIIKHSHLSKEYFLNIKNNLLKIYEKIQVQKKLAEIEFGKEEEIINENRKKLNEEFEFNINTLRKSLGLNNQNLTKMGYVSIFSLISGVILCGMLIAYVILTK